MMLEEYEEDRLVKGHYYKKHHKDPISSIFNGTGVATLYDAEGIFLRKVIYSKGKAIDPEDWYHLSKIIFTDTQRILPRTKVWSSKPTQRVFENEDEGPQVKDARSCEDYFW